MGYGVKHQVKKIFPNFASIYDPWYIYFLSDFIFSHDIKSIYSLMNPNYMVPG